MTTVKTVHLICNAHIDPVWQWQWEEGVAEAVSTFRVAADFCEEFDGFIFCHNEAIIYEWVESYEPEIFRRIQKLVKAGRWHIMGGWYLQPDCNMPAGESFVRQILLGREYFWKKFRKRPTTAINFDPFGHSRGLVQIMAKSGYDSYLFCRPHSQELCELPAGQFEWEGFDGSRVRALRCWNMYSSKKGKATQRIEEFITANNLEENNPLLWGIGNHGGGPSHKDLMDIKKMMADCKNVNMIHSTPEAYFKVTHKKPLPVVAKGLNAWGVGCYTSQILIKQLNRRLENELFSTEKMLASAWKQGLLKTYPADELEQTMRDLAFLQFHDTLPGTCIKPVEEASIRLANHGLEILSRLKARAFFVLSSGQKKAKTKTIPLLVYNPHPYNVAGPVECEYQLEDMVFPPCEDLRFTIGKVFCNGTELPSQMEKEDSSLEVDWRKRIVFHANLKPSQMNRFDCELVKVKERPRPELKSRNGKFNFKSKDISVVVNAKTGLIDSYKVAGLEILQPGAFLPLVMVDNEDPWGMLSNRFDKVGGRFNLLTPAKSAQFSGVKSKTLPPVRVIENGDVRTVVEAVFGFNDSFLCQRYSLPKQGTQIGIETNVIWNEKDRLLKLNIPMKVKKPQILGQVAYGVEDFTGKKDELVAQKWVGVADGKNAATLINDGVYGFDFVKDSLRPTLLRSAAYCAHPIPDEEKIIPQDRFLPRIDTGERSFKFVLNAGPKRQRLDAVDREAVVLAEKPMALSFFPSGNGRKAERFITLSGETVRLAAMKKAQHGNDLIVRLFNPTGDAQKTTLAIQPAKIREKLELSPFEIRTLKVSLKNRTLTEIPLDERP